MDHAILESTTVTSPSTGRSPRYPDDFIREAVRLITEEQYKFKAAARSV